MIHHSLVRYVHVHQAGKESDDRQTPARRALSYKGQGRGRDDLETPNPSCMAAVLGSSGASQQAGGLMTGTQVCTALRPDTHAQRLPAGRGSRLAADGQRANGRVGTPCGRGL